MKIDFFEFWCLYLLSIYPIGILLHVIFGG